MPSFYIVVQYVPDPIADERANIGVIAYDEGRIEAQFLADWKRVRSFGRRNVDRLREFAREFPAAATNRQIQLPHSPHDWTIDKQELERMANEWSNSIQFTRPRASMLTPEELIQSVSGKFLIEPKAGQKTYRDRRTAAQLAFASVAEALEPVAGNQTRDFLKRNYPLMGTIDEHRFDLALANGRLICAMHAFSFEVEDTTELSKDVDATAWLISDVRAKDPGLPLALAYIPPHGASKAYQKAKRVTQGLGVAMIASDEIGKWAESEFTRIHGGEHRLIT